ncbi:MAG: hypothetical protein ACI9W4_000859 [Rhodothermales bacterium]|jgi:hypothetical protein
MKALLGFLILTLMPVLAPRNLVPTVNGPDVTLIWQAPELASSNAEVEPNNRLPERQHLFAPSPAQIDGSVQKSDAGQLSVSFADGSVDDFEDLFDFSIAAGGGLVTLTGLSEDTDLYLLSEASGQLEIEGESFNIGAESESITLADTLEGEFADDAITYLYVLTHSKNRETGILVLLR